MRAKRSPVWIVIVVALSVTQVSRSGATQPVDLLARLREFVVRFNQAAPSLVARESYQQTVSYRSLASRPATRTLISELVMVKLPGTGGWISFRDVLEVDKRKVNDRERRLVELLQTPSSSAIQQARQVAVLRFSEERGPTILRNSEGRDLLVSGRVWVEPESGALVRTELIVRDRNSSGSCIVDFITDARLEATVPSKMTERYEFGGTSIDAVAQYSDYRRFGVSTDEKLTKPPGLER